MLAQEQDHQRCAMTEADQDTRDFHGLDENGTYRPPTRTQEEMCEELQTLDAGYSGFSLPDDFDFSPYRLARHLFDVGDPKPQNEQMRSEGWPEFCDYTSASMDAIDRQVLASPIPLSPAQVLKIAIDANGGNVPTGLLAAHNYLKHLSYFGRFYADPTYREEGLQQPVVPETGASVAKLEPWRQEDPANPAGRLDKMGPLYHIFAGAVVKAWFPDAAATESFGDMAIGMEALLRTAAGWLGKDTPDREKGRADECGARLGGTVVALGRGEKPPVVAEETPQPEQDADGIQDGVYVGEVYTTTSPDVPVWEILESRVELVVTDESIAVALDNVLQYAARSSSTRGVLCTATVHVFYSGRGTVVKPLSLPLELVDSELVSIEGPQCGAGGSWKNTAEEDVLASLNGPSWQTCTLAGAFSDGFFQGDITAVTGVRATRATE